MSVGLSKVVLNFKRAVITIRTAMLSSRSAAFWLRSVQMLFKNETRHVLCELLNESFCKSHSNLTLQRINIIACTRSPLMAFLLILRHSEAEIQFRTTPDLPVSQLSRVLKKNALKLFRLISVFSEIVT
jgi:hypothetical protein